MRKLNASTITGAMLLMSIAPSVVQSAATAKTNSSHARGKAGAAAPASPKAKGRKKSRSKKRDTSWRRGQRGPTPDRINEIQEALAKQGAYTGAPSGKWDAKTVEGMRRFQSAHNLNPTGKLDALTLQKLGLGSDIAGIAPPQPLMTDDPTAPRRPR